MSDEIFKRLGDLERKIDLILTAFPDGVIAHAEQHRRETSSADTNRRMRLAAMEHVIKGSVWAVMAALFLSAMAYIKDHWK